MKELKFALGQIVKLESGETGTVIARAEYAAAEPSYLLRYKSGTGRMTEVWWGESALEAV